MKQVALLKMRAVVSFAVCAATSHVAVTSTCRRAQSPCSSGLCSCSLCRLSSINGSIVHVAFMGAHGPGCTQSQ